MPLEFVINQQGNRDLVVDGYILHKQKILKSGITWRCELYDDTRCTGRVRTSSDKRSGEYRQIYLSIMKQ